MNEPVGHSPRPRDHLDFRAVSVSAGSIGARDGRGSAAIGLVDDETDGVGSWNGVSALDLDWIWARDWILGGAAGSLRRALAGEAQTQGEVILYFIYAVRSYLDPVFRSGGDWETNR